MNRTTNANWPSFSLDVLILVEFQRVLLITDWTGMPSEGGHMLSLLVTKCTKPFVLRAICLFSRDVEMSRNANFRFQPDNVESKRLKFERAIGNTRFVPSKSRAFGHCYGIRQRLFLADCVIYQIFLTGGPSLDDSRYV